MSTPIWSPGTLYQPGTLVKRRTAAVVVQSAPDNANFDDGNTGWTFPAGCDIINSSPFVFDGAWVGEFQGTTSGVIAFVNDNVVPVVPGQSINAWVYVNTTGETSLGEMGGEAVIVWYTAAMAHISDSRGTQVQRSNNEWHKAGVTDTAPATAAFAQLQLWGFRNSGTRWMYFDASGWNYSYSAPLAGLLFKAVQALSGTSANIEPIWPTSLGGTVVDNEVTWEAVQASRVVWQATPILKSDATEPTWPTTVGSHVADGTIGWQATSRRITDVKCPQSKIVIIGASKIFAADGDIIPFSATVNPLDWSTPNDAGYIPFGLNTYGANPVAAMGLYRSNLMAFNATGYQMWQIDQDPASMAILDAEPIPCTYHKSLQPVQNDLAFLTSLGVRSVGIAGASTNLQAGNFGKAIDPLVIAEIKALAGGMPRGLYFPAQGQYWLFFGAQAFVLTIDGGVKDMSWTRYIFPSVIDNWTILDNALYLRSGDLVWRVDADALQDDMQDPVSIFTAAISHT